MIIECKDQKFLVISIELDVKSTFPRNLCFRIPDDECGILKNIDEARIIDGTMPLNWTMFQHPINQDGYFFTPKSWYDYGVVELFEDIDDRKKEAMSIYKKSVIEMWEECGKGFVEFPEFLCDSYYDDESLVLENTALSTQKNLAKSMFEDGISIELIKKYTGLSTEQIANVMQITRYNEK